MNKPRFDKTTKPSGGRMCPSDRGATRGMHFGIRRCRSAGFLVFVVFTAWSLTLPMRLSPEIFQAERRAAMPGAMTIGCAEASCCTPRCYLDENGTHHCVPDDSKSCTCGLSAGAPSTAQLPLSETATLPSLQTEIAKPGYREWMAEFPKEPAAIYLVPLTPPPRA